MAARRHRTKITGVASSVTTLTLALLINLHPVLAQEKTFFRITDDSGKVELKATITPEEAKKGYAIVTLGGHVVKEVAAELSAEEIAHRFEAQKKANDEAERQAEEQYYNESLLLRYSNLDDLESEKRRKLGEFDVRISILRSNLAGLKEKLQAQQALAANIERLGNKVPSNIIGNIDGLEQEMREIEASIKQRKKEKINIGEKYSADAARLEKLLVTLDRR